MKFLNTLNISRAPDRRDFLKKKKVEQGCNGSVTANYVHMECGSKYSLLRSASANTIPRLGRVSERTVCDPFFKHATVGYVVTQFY